MIVDYDDSSSDEGESKASENDNGSRNSSTAVSGETGNSLQRKKFSYQPNIEPKILAKRCPSLQHERDALETGFSHKLKYHNDVEDAQIAEKAQKQKRTFLGAGFPGHQSRELAKHQKASYTSNHSVGFIPSQIATRRANLPVEL